MCEQQVLNDLHGTDSQRCGACGLSSCIYLKSKRHDSPGGIDFVIFDSRMFEVFRKPEGLGAIDHECEFSILGFTFL